MKGRLVILSFVLVGGALAQAPPPSVKPTPASDALVIAAKDQATSQASLDTILNQARTTINTNSKQLQQTIAVKTDDLQKKLKEDKKYAPMIAEIEKLQADFKSLQSNAQADFNKQTMPIQQKIASDGALIDGLVPIVAKENGISPEEVKKWVEGKKK